MRRARVRKQIRGSEAKPRLCVSKSLKYTSAQLISDDSGRVLAAVSSREIFAEGKSRSSRESAKEVGRKIAELAQSKKISAIVFDRNGFVYHGRVAAVAEGAREAGLKF